MKWDDYANGFRSLAKLGPFALQVERRNFRVCEYFFSFCGVYPDDSIQGYSTMKEAKIAAETYAKHELLRALTDLLA